MDVCATVPDVPRAVPYLCVFIPSAWELKRC